MSEHDDILTFLIMIRYYLRSGIISFSQVVPGNPLQAVTSSR